MGATKLNGADAAPPASGQLPVALLMLPYSEISHALLRAHRNAVALSEANKALAEQLRQVMRRQQDLAMELTEQAVERARAGEPINPAAMFDQAAAVVREIGQAYIDAQLTALRRLQAEAAPAAPASEPVRPPQQPVQPGGR